MTAVHMFDTINSWTTLGFARNAGEASSRQAATGSARPADHTISAPAGEKGGEVRDLLRMPGRQRAVKRPLARRSDAPQKGLCHDSDAWTSESQHRTLRL